MGWGELTAFELHGDGRPFIPVAAQLHGVLPAVRVDELGAHGDRVDVLLRVLILLVLFLRVLPPVIDARPAAASAGGRNGRRFVQEIRDCLIAVAIRDVGGWGCLDVFNFEPYVVDVGYRIGHKTCATVTVDDLVVVTEKAVEQRVERIPSHPGE